MELISPVLCVLFCLTSIQLFCLADSAQCPPNTAQNVHHNVLRVNSTTVIMQQGLSHKVPCDKFVAGEKLDYVGWYKETVKNNPLTYWQSNNDNEASNKYSMTDDFSLLITDVDKGDEGLYICRLNKMDTTDEKRGKIMVRVIDHTFPLSGSINAMDPIRVDVSLGQRRVLLCQCMPTDGVEPSAVYWSEGDVDSTETDIIGTRFADGTVPPNCHGANYAIGIDGSLTINSWSNVHDHYQFRCHVFQSHANLVNCYTIVTVQDTSSYINPLRASKSTFYAVARTNISLPFLDWTSGEPACAFTWLKSNMGHQQLLSYNLYSGTIEANSSFSLAADFGLIILSVKENHSGLYISRVTGPGNKTKTRRIDLRVIDEFFPAAPATCNTSSSAVLKRGFWNTVQCPSVQDSPHASIQAVFWSSGEGVSKKTQVIGFCSGNDTSCLLLDNGNCTIDGNFSLRIRTQEDTNNKLPDGLWCHAFWSDTLHSCYSDITEESNGSSNSIPVWVIIAVSIIAVSLIAVILLVCLIYNCKSLRRTCNRDVSDGGYGNLQTNGGQ